MPSLITIPYTIEEGKETGLVQLNVTPKPLILCSLAAINPATLLVDSGSDVTYLTTTPALGGKTQTYNGNVYEARLQGNPIEQIQAQSPQGYDIPGSISLVIADGDFTIWTTHANAFGWRGGTLTVTFVLWDAPTGAYSTNAYVWTFILDKPNVDFGAGIIKVTGQARQSMTRLTVPNFARQNRCGNIFPGATGATRAVAAAAAAVARLDGLTNPTSLSFGCGYSPDLISIGGVGNVGTPNLDNPDGSFLTDASGYYLMCDYSRSCGSGRATRTQGCMARLGNYAATTTYGSGGKPCGQDGDIANDTGNRATGHFTGDTWVAPQGWSGNQYVNPGAGTQYGFNAPNSPIGNGFYSQGYGTQWVDATVLEPFSGANDLIAECIVCVAPNGPATVLKVLVNGVEVPFNNDPLQSFTWVCLPVGSTSSGGRKGIVTQLAVINGQGDPHGSMCWIIVTIPSELAGSGTIPAVRVLVQFPQCLHAMPIATAVSTGAANGTTITLPAGIANADIAGNPPYTINIRGNSLIPNGSYGLYNWTTGPPGTVTLIGTIAAGSGAGGSIFYIPDNDRDVGFTEASTGAVAANPVWALMDLLACWGPFTVLDIDAASWYAAAQICAVQIGYTDINNNAATHARFRCSLALVTGQRQTLAKAVLAIRNCAGLILARNPANGLLQCFIEQTLADQQGAPIPGSNYSTAVASMPATSITLIPSLTTPGYLAYLFDGGSATVPASIEKSTFKLGGRTLSDTPNTISFPFQDGANQFVQDTITTIDPDGYATSGNQEIAASFAVLGIDNFDQGTRVSNVELAKALYGNSRFDARGTELPSFKTTVKAAHLASRVGFICGINYAQASLEMVLARLLSATPNTDGEHWDLAFRWHFDQWHTDLYGQDPAPYQKNPLSAAPNRPPWPLKPGYSAWPTNDALYPGLETIGLYTTNGQITVASVPVVNVPSALTSAPRVPLQATVGSGGAIAAGTWLVSFVGIDAAGAKSQPSANVKAVVASGGSTITVSNIVWDSNAVNYEVYFGPHSLNMWLVDPAPSFAHNPVASSITIGAEIIWPTDGPGRPDVVDTNVMLLVTPIRHGGIWGDGASAVATHTLSFPSSPTVNQWAGRILSAYGSATPIPIGGVGPQTFAGLCYAQPASYNVTANDTSGNMTVTQSTSGNPGDAYVMRAVANIASATTIGDTAFVNQFAPGGLVVNAEYGKVVWIMAGTGAGQKRNIASNTATTCTITQAWTTIPDSTSVFSILESAPSLSIPCAAFTNNGIAPSGAAILGVMQVPFSSAGSQSFLVQVVTQDAKGNISPVRFAPWQEVFVPALTSSAFAPASSYLVPVVAGTATPDASQAVNLLILTAANCLTDANGNKYVNVAPPINYSTTPSGVETPWQFITQEDPVGGTGGYSTIFDPSYKIAFAVASAASPADTQCHVDFRTSSAGVTTPTGALIDQPI